MANKEVNNMLVDFSMKRIEFFKEDCESVINKFRATLFNYDSEKHGDFRGFAISDAIDKKTIISHLHHAALIMVDETDLKTIRNLLEILNSAFKRIDEDMKHTNSYIEYVNYLETKQN
jgi:hypothetical protein